MIRTLLLLTLLLDRRIVDRVNLGDPTSEATHACERTASWTRCALTTFDDTEVTISASFAGASSARTFDLIVEDRTVATHTYNSRDSTTVELRVPREVTAGRTNIIVMLRGQVSTLIALRTVQDHNE